MADSGKIVMAHRRRGTEQATLRVRGAGEKGQGDCLATCRRRSKSVLVMPKIVRAAVSCILLTSCSPDLPKLQELQQEVNPMAEAGGAIAPARSKLEAAGFSCNDDNPIYCSRGWYGFLVTCNERIFIFVDKEKSTISRTEIPNFFCAGL